MEAPGGILQRYPSAFTAALFCRVKCERCSRVVVVKFDLGKTIDFYRDIILSTETPRRSSIESGRSELSITEGLKLSLTTTIAS